MNDLLFFLIGALLTLSVTVAVRRLGNVDGASDWLIGWVCILLAGLFQMFVAPNSLISLSAPVFDTLFAGLLLSGTLRFVGKYHHLKALWITVCLVGVTRCLLEPIVSFSLGAFSATFIIALASLCSADLLAKFGRTVGLPATRTFSMVFLLPAFAQLNFGWVSTSQSDLTTAFFLWLMAGSLLIMVQLFLLIEKARFEAQVSREALATMAEAAPVGLCLTDPGGRIRACNDMAARLLMFAPASNARVQDLIVEASNLTLNDLDQISRGCTAQFANADTVGVSNSAIAPDSRLVGYVWFFHQFNVSRAKAEVTPQANQLQALKEVAGSFAHVINNRLMVISGSAELLGLNASETADNHLKRLSTAVDQCARTTEELLRIVEDSLQPGSTPVGQTISRIAQDHSLEIEVNLGDTAHLHLDVSETAFATAVNELVQRACEAGRTNAVISSRRPADSHFLEISITGQRHDSQRDVSSFDHAHNSKQMNHQEGLGIAAGIIESRGGEIRIEEGTRGTQLMTLWPLAGTLPNR